MDKIERLKKFDDAKLIDVVKNYKQYGYEEELRDAAIAILGERGIDKEQLKLSGNFENKSYNSAEVSYKSFSKSSKIAFVFYLILIISQVMASFVLVESALAIPVILLQWGAFIVYVVFLIKSFIAQRDFYKSVNKVYGVGSVLLFWVLGMPFYLFVFFYIRNQMKEEMKLVR